MKAFLLFLRIFYLLLQNIRNDSFLICQKFKKLSALPEFKRKAQGCSHMLPEPVIKRADDFEIIDCFAFPNLHVFLGTEEPCNSAFQGTD